MLKISIRWILYRYITTINQIQKLTKNVTLLLFVINAILISFLSLFPEDHHLH